jgi:hypothetical protein
MLKNASEVIKMNKPQIINLLKEKAEYYNSANNSEHAGICNVLSSIIDEIEKSEPEMYISELIKHTGRTVVLPELTAKTIVEAVEKLNPKFTDGEEIIVCGDEYTVIDYGRYENAMRELHYED